jgi:hypothetical protein
VSRPVVSATREALQEAAVVPHDHFFRPVCGMYAVLCRGKNVRVAATYISLDLDLGLYVLRVQPFLSCVSPWFSRPSCYC